MKKIASFDEPSNAFIRSQIEIFLNQKIKVFDNLDRLFFSNSDLFLIYPDTAMSMSIEFWKNIISQQFVNTNKKLIIGIGNDALLDLVPLMKNYELLDIFSIIKDRVYFLYTGEIEKHTKFFNNIDKFNHESLNFSLSFRQNFITNPTIFCNKKRTDSFLLTTIIKNSRPHRKILVDQLNNQNILDFYIGNISYQKDYNNWAGSKYFNNDFADGTVSWDIYEQSSFEIVPETYYQYFSFPTEKTFKPILAKVPFLILANPQYYQHLKHYGFKTFNSLINESFAHENDLETRAKKLAETAKYILDNGALDFYHASKEICDYNYEHLFYLSKKQEQILHQRLYNFFSEA